MTQKLTATEAADALALQVVVDARRCIKAGTMNPDGARFMQEVLSDCLGGYRGAYLQRCAETAAYRTVRTAVRRMTRA